MAFVSGTVLEMRSLLLFLSPESPMRSTCADTLCPPSCPPWPPTPGGGALAWIPRRVAKEAGHRVTNVTHAREPPQRRLPRAVVIANLFDSLTEFFRTKIIPDYIFHVKIQRQF